MLRQLQNYLENARISDDLDFAVISGWESTAIENHSGIVDNLRNFKSDPTPISATLQPVRPMAKQRSACTARGESAIFDLYLLNDTPQPATGTLTFTVVTPSNKLLKLAEFPAPQHIPDRFSYLVKESFQTPPLAEEGLYRFKFSLSSAPLSTQTKEIWVTAPPVMPIAGIRRRIGVAGITPQLRKQLEHLANFTQFEVVDFKTQRGICGHHNLRPHFHRVFYAKLRRHHRTRKPTGRETGAVQTTTKLGHIDPYILDVVHLGTPLLAIPQADALSEGVAQQLAPPEPSPTTEP